MQKWKDKDDSLCSNQKEQIYAKEISVYHGSRNIVTITKKFEERWYNGIFFKNTDAEA